MEFNPIRVLLSGVICMVLSGSAFGQNAFEAGLRRDIDALATSAGKPHELYPNDASQGIMVPSGWGGFGTYLFGFLGGAYPEVYTDKKFDLIAAAGISVGDPERFVNFSVSVNVGSLRRMTDFSGNFSISRSLSASSSISVGGLQLLASPIQSDAPGATFYLAFSHAIQSLPSRTPGLARLSYTIGIGNGRFLEKSERDMEAGKGKYGTAVFGSVSYEIIRHMNLNAEWSGMNLGFSIGCRPFHSSLSFNIGVTNLTNYSADKPSMIFSMGYPLSLNRNKF